MKKEATEKVLAEYGIRPEDARAYIVEHPFRLQVRYGPLVAIEKGETVLLGKQTGTELFFSNKVAPKEVGEFFRVIRPFRHVKDEEWIGLKVGDILKLEREEAMRFLRKQYVLEVETEEVEINES